MRCRRYAYPIPQVRELPGLVWHCWLFHEAGFKGNWQIPLSLESKEKMAFSTLYGLHQFPTLPIGLFGAQPLSSSSWTGCYVHTLHMLPPVTPGHVQRVAAVLESLR